MHGSSDLALWLALWMAAATVILYKVWKGRFFGVGLVLAYLLNLWLMHWVAASIYLLPWDQHFEVDLVALGLEQSTYGVLAFTFGSLVLTPMILSFRHLPNTALVSYESHQSLPKAYMLIGAVSYLLLSSTLGQLPTATALVSVGQQLFVVGLCLACWKAWQEGDMKRFLGWLGVGLLMLLITIMSRGFIGYGAVATFTVLVFIVSFYRPHWQLVLAALLVGYVGLSFYVSYMRDRNDIREVVWGGQPWGERVGQVYETIRTLDWFGPRALTHPSQLQLSDYKGKCADHEKLGHCSAGVVSLHCLLEDWWCRGVRSGGVARHCAWGLTQCLPVVLRQPRGRWKPW